MASVATTTEQPALGVEERASQEQRLLGVVISVGLWVVTCVTLVSALVVVAAHLDDRFDLNQGSGTWMALAQDFHDGTLYRAVFADGVFGGTWYMPVQVFLSTGMSLVTDEYVVSGKVLALFLAAVLYGLVFLVLRRLVGCGRLLSAALVAVLLSTSVGLHAVTAIRGDTLPVIFQVAAVALIARSTSRRAVAAAGVLCALALLSKLTAVWALAAITIWLFVRHRRLLLMFFGVTIVSFLVPFIAVDAASNGRLADNLQTILDGNSGASPFAGTSVFFSLLTARASAIWLLLPIALLAIGASAVRRTLTIFQLAFAIELPLLLVVMGAPGSDYNHLLDAAVLTVLVVGEFTVRAAASSERLGEMSWVTALVAIAIILGIADSYRVSLKPEVKNATEELLGRTETPYPTRPLAGIVTNDDIVLSEDPTVPVAMGERPEILDSIMLRRLMAVHPDWRDALERRLAAREFDKIILINPVSDTAWYRDSFGLDVRDAIRDNYELARRVSRPPYVYWVYVPAKDASSG